MTTTMTFALSPALTTQLAAQPNSYVFALQYAGGQFVAGSSTAALVANGPMAVRACKKLVQDVAGRAIAAELRADTARRIADIRASDEGREGIASFLGKRAPNWLA